VTGTSRTSALRALYIVLSYIAAPAAFFLLLWRGFGNHGYWQRLGERLGYGTARAAGNTIWIHAVSVGEVQAAVPLVEALIERFPKIPVAVTTMSPTGSARARVLFGDRVLHSYAPYDLPGAVGRFFDRFRPRIAIIMETELWPNLYHECGRRGIPLVLASARISPRSMGRYRVLVGLFRETLSHGIVIAAQSRRDADRFIQLGAPPERTHVVGTLKFDQPLPSGEARWGHGFRDTHWPGRAVWIAASTHPGEEQAVIEIQRRLNARGGNQVLLLAPRHPERCDSVEEMLVGTGLKFCRRSRCEPAEVRPCDVYLIDTLGELNAFYGCADVAFVGGSLVPIGGHNLLEPASHGVPIITGPYNFNSEDVLELLEAEGAAEVVGDAERLGLRIASLLGDPAERARRGECGRRVVAANRGAVGRLLEFLQPLIFADHTGPDSTRTSAPPLAETAAQTDAAASGSPPSGSASRRLP
jgi:3-deoxy-D-manno-octulosonic-acid transferase